MVKKIVALFLLWRIFLFIVAALAPLVVPIFANRFPYVEILIQSKLPYWIWSFGNFDGVHYLRIAKDGYAYQYTQAFFPIYPMVIKLVSFITFGNYLLSGLLVSNISFLFSLIMLYKLIVKIYNPKIALWSIIFLLAFPTSFYFGAVYTEGLFFLLIISSFYQMEQNKNWLAAGIGLFASGTRLVGIFLSLSIFTKKNLKSRLPILLTPLGFLAYVIYLQLKFKNGLYFLTAQSAFGQNRQATKIILLPQVIYRWINQLLTTHGLVFANSLFELTTTVLTIILLVYGLKTIKKEWILFSLFAILTPTLTGSLASMPRYVLVAFPVFVVLAQIKSDLVKCMIAVLFLTGLVVSTILFTRGYWIA
jgi:Gpi18-like mannosyltransferase